MLAICRQVMSLPFALRNDIADTESENQNLHVVRCHIAREFRIVPLVLTVEGCPVRDEGVALNLRVGHRISYETVGLIGLLPSLDLRHGLKRADLYHPFFSFQFWKRGACFATAGIGENMIGKHVAWSYHRCGI